MRASQEEISQKESEILVPGFGERFLKVFGDLKQVEIAELLGVATSTVTNYTKGRVPKTLLLLKVWELTKCDLHWLLTGEHFKPVETSTPLPPLPLENSERQLVEQVAQNENKPFDQALRTLVTEALISRGLMRKQASPTMLVLRTDIKLVAVPLIGSISAGQPITYFKDKEQKQVLVADVFLLDGYQSFALQVVGNEDEGFSDGDYIICCNNIQPQSGQVVVAAIDDGHPTTRRIFFEGPAIRLQPISNKSPGDLYSAERVKIIYTVTGVQHNP